MLNMRDDIGIWKSITVGELRRCMIDLADDHRIVINGVGNIAVMVGLPGDEDNWDMVGYIDIAGGYYESMLEEPEDPEHANPPVA
jgi:hypothetical protein